MINDNSMSIPFTEVSSIKPVKLGAFSAVILEVSVISGKVWQCYSVDFCPISGEIELYGVIN